MHRSWHERVASVALILFSLVFLILAFLIPTPPFRQQLGPDAFPKAIAAVMLLCSVVYAVQAFRGRHGASEARATVIGAEEKVEAPADLRTMAFMLAAMVFYAAAFERLGYAISTFLVFMAGVLYLDRRHLVRDVAIAVVGSFGLYLVFTRVLRVVLPGGPLRLLGW
jgi:putative tricarboxylic transport membrane protein